MAKENYDFDDDFNDFNMGMDDNTDPFSPKDSPSSGNRSPVAKAGKSMLSGASQEIKNPTFYRNILKAALPESFSVTLDNIDSVTDIGQRTYSQAMREARPMMTQVRKVAGSINRIVPSPFQSKIDEYLKSKDRKGLEDMQPDMEEAAVSQGMGDLFAQQEQDDRKTEQAKELLDYVTEKDYRKNILTQLGSINRQLTLQTENQLKIQRAWQSKSLEVQLRHLYISRQTMQITKQGMEENSMLLRDVVKNTALPDIQKEQQSETLTRLTRERVFGAAQSKVSDWARQNRYLRAVGQRLQKSVRNKVNEFQYGFQSAADMFDSVEEQLKAAKEYGIDTSEMAAEMAGANLMNRAGGFVGKHVGKRLGADRLDKTFRTFNKNFADVAHHGARLGRRWKRGNNRLGQWAGDILDVPFQQDTTVATGRLADLELNAGRMNTDERKLQALEITLPGLLSRILQSSEGIRTGVLPDRLTLDPQKGVFVSMKDSTQNMAQAVLSDEAIANAQNSLHGLVKDIGGDKLSRKQRQELARHLREKSRDQTWAFNPENLLDKGNGLSEGLRTKLGTSLSSRYGLVYDHAKEKWKTPLSGLTGIRSLERDSRSYNNFRDYSSDVFKNVKAIHSLGGIEQLLQAGIVRWDDNSQTYELDPEYVERRSNAKFKKLQRPGRSTGEPEMGPGLNGPRPNDGNDGSGQPSPKPSGAPIGGGEDGEQASGLKRLFGRGGGGGSNGVVKAIRDQTESMLDAFENLPIREVQEEQADYLADILERLEAGVNTFAGGPGTAGGRPGLLRRGARLAGRGIKGVWKATAYPLKLARVMAKQAFRPVKWMGRKSFGRIKGLGEKAWGKASALVTDVYVKGQDGLKRALERGLMLAGSYTDVKTGKVIKSIKDITGAVINNATGEIVLTQEDFDNGLMNSLGKRLKQGLIGGVTSAIKRAGSIIASPITKPLQWAKSGLSAVKKLMLTPPDVYLRGQMDKPILYGQQMYNGMYWSSATNKVVRYVGDIDGDVYTWDRESMQKRIVLTAQQIQDPGLVDSTGKPLKGFMKKWKDRADGAIGFLKKNLNPLNWLRKGKELAKKGLGMLAAPWKAVRNAFGGGGGGAGGWTKRIYRLLWNKFNDLPLNTGLKAATSELGEKAGALGSKVKDWWANRKGFGLKSKFAESKLGGLLAGLFGGVKGFNWKSLFHKDSMKDRLDEMRNREGSWVNRLSSAAGRVKDSAKDKIDKARKFPWLNTIMTGFGIVSSAVMGFKKKFMDWGGTLFKWLPKVLEAIRDTKLVKGGMDMLGDMFGGRGGGRGRGGLLRRGARALGRGAWNAVRHPFKTLGKVAKSPFKLAGGALRLGLKALPWVARGAMALLTSPVAWVAAAAVGAGYLIYKGYKAYQGRITSVREMRLAQYGFSKSDDSDKLGKVLALEEACMKVVQWDSNGVPSLGPLKYPELIQAFDIPLTAEKSVMSWATWFSNRFRPVFLKNIQEIHTRDAKATILDPNTSLPKGALPGYALATRLPDNAPNGERGPYYTEQSPFQNHACIIGTDLVDSTIQAVVAEYAADAKKYKTSERNKANLGNAENIALTPKAGKNMQAGMQLQKTDQVYGAGDVQANIGKITGNPDKDLKIIQANLIDDVTAVRMKMYGMRELSKSQVDLIWRLEESIMDLNVIFTSGKLAAFTGDVNKIVQQWAPVFGVSLGVAADVNDWQFWFERRFLPVLLNFCTRGNKWLGMKNLQTKVRTAHPEVQYSIAEFMSVAKTTVNEQEVSVWSVNAYPFPMESANTDSLVIKGNMDSLKSRIKAEKYAEALAKKDPKLKVGPDGKPLSDAEFMKRISQQPGSALPTNAVNAANLAAAGGRSALNGGGGLTSFDTTGFNSVEDLTPNGGKAADLPQIDGAAVSAAGSADKRFAMLKPLFEAVAKMVGVDVPTLTAFAMQESGFDPLARAKGSSAAGLFQFINSTWGQYADKLKAFGFSNPVVTDPVANTVAGAMFIRDNIQALKSTVGRMPNIPELYLAHFLGPGGARKVLSQPDSASIMTGVNSDQIRANPGVFKNISTIADIKQWAARMMQKGISFSSKNAGAAIPQQGYFQTNMGSAPAEAGSIVNTQAMGSPTAGGDGAGAIPATAPTINMPGSVAPVTNKEATTGALRKVRAESPVATSTAGASPVPMGREGVNQQRQIQEEKVVERTQNERAVAASNQSRAMATGAQVRQMRDTHTVQEDIRDNTGNTAQLLREIKEILSGGPTSGGSTPPSSVQDTRKDMMLKNASTNPPVGNSPNSKPFNTGRKSA
jgi:hypothetical protein